jgi:hypothetical protein
VPVRHPLTDGGSCPGGDLLGRQRAAEQAET